MYRQLKSGTTAILLRTDVGVKEIVHTTQDYQVGTYLIINNDPKRQGNVRPNSYNYHKNLRVKVEKDPNASIDEERSTPLETMKPAKVIKHKFKDDLTVRQGKEFFPYKGKLVAKDFGGEFYLCHEFTEKYEPCNDCYIIVEGKSGMPVGQAWITDNRPSKYSEEDCIRDIERLHKAYSCSRSIEDIVRTTIQDTEKLKK